MRFRILGALQILGRERPLPLEPRLARIVAVLLVASGRNVSRDHLIDAVWDDDPPPTAVRQLYNCISTLRQRLSDHDMADPGVVTGPSGYWLAVGAGQVDATCFLAHCADARTRATAGHTADAVEAFRSGLALWRGPALTGMGGKALEAEAARLNEQRLAALEDCVDLELQLGRRHDLVGELVALVTAYPHRERMVGQLMLALHCSGQRSEALRVFHRLRHQLAEELGIDPGAELQQLHATILRDDNDMPVTKSYLVPRLLPAPVRHFVGRSAQLSRLEKLAGLVGGDHVVIAALDGMGGVGKTSLAVRWAQQAAERFPDGQLFVNLRGNSPDAPPMAPAEAIRGFLDALGVPADRVPPDPQAQGNLYRSLLPGRRMLVLLDDAIDAKQVRPLLPGTPSCMVLITSREQLTGLAVAEGAYSISLDVLTCEEARHLLAARLGEERLAAEPEASAAIIKYCANLPLALAVIAARATGLPAFPLAAFAAELADLRCRLDAMDGGDPSTRIRAVFSGSYQRLPTAAARLFRLLGLHVRTDITLPAAASLAGLSLGQIRQPIEALTRARLLNESTPGRYAFHDLVSAYALDLAQASGSDR